MCVLQKPPPKLALKPEKKMTDTSKDFIYDKFTDSSNYDNPCMSICDYNGEDYCVGCKRHMNEIFDWYDYTDEMRAAINKDLVNRKVTDYWGDW